MSLSDAGFLDTGRLVARSSWSTAGRYRFSGDDAHALAAISYCGADTVALTGTERFGVQGIRQLMWRLETMDVDLVVAPGVMDVAQRRLALRPVAGFPLLHVEKPQYKEAKCFQKRAFDFCFSLTALIGTVATAHRISHRDQAHQQRAGLLPVRADRPGWQAVHDAQVPDHGGRGGHDRSTSLLSLNESTGGMLFKIRQDPRVTAPSAKYFGDSASMSCRSSSTC